MKKKLLKVSVLILAGVIVTVGCNKDDETPTPTPTSTSPSVPIPTVDLEDYSDEISEIKENYASLVYANYEDSYNAAIALKSALTALTDMPSPATLDAAKDAWLQAREPYGQTEAFRFAKGPIDDEDGPEGLLNAWPLDENFIDYVKTDPNSGIINNSGDYPTITEEVLEGLNEDIDEKSISIGYHAIEFLLWGQDDAETSLKTPGNRPHTDFSNGNGPGNERRRAQYLLKAGDLLVGHLKLMVDEWAPGTQNYRADFLALDDEAVLERLLTSIGTLSKSELAVERIFVPLENADQEDEHSCFSDNTHRDIILNAEGIKNVYTGSYTRIDNSVVSGTSLQDLLGMVSPALKMEMDALSASTITNSEAIPVPFDYALTQETTGGNGPIMNTVTSLQNQGDKISQVATALGVSISTNLE
jgi:putative iron-regulated protein